MDDITADAEQASVSPTKRQTIGKVLALIGSFQLQFKLF